MTSNLKIDIRMGNTHMIPKLVSEIPLDKVWLVLLETYAKDVGNVPFATDVWRLYKINTMEAAIELAIQLALQPKFRLTRWISGIVKKIKMPSDGDICKLIGRMVGNLQSAYRYDWDPYLQYQIFAAVSHITDFTKVWEYIIEIAPILGKNILFCLASLKAMHKLTNQIEFFILALVSITQPGEWCINGEIITSCENGVPSYCYDLETEIGWNVIRDISNYRNYTRKEAIEFGIKKYYNTVLKVTNERNYITLPIYKYHARRLDLDKFNLSQFENHLKILSIIRKLPRKNGIIDEIMEITRKK